MRDAVASQPEESPCEVVSDDINVMPEAVEASDRG
jgi:hypothetical protein